MKRFAGRVGGLAVTALGALTCTTAPVSEPVRLETFEQATQMLERTAAERRRLKDIEFALTHGSQGFCGELVVARVGGIFGTGSSFVGPIGQRAAMRALDLGDALSVVHVARGGPLERAGVRAGDRILSVDGAPVRALEDLGAAVSAQVTAARSEGRALPQRFAPLRLQLLRDSQETSARVEPVRACPIQLSTATSPALLPVATGTFVATVPLGLLRFMDSDDQLASILGHQIAHQLFDRDGDDLVTRESRADRIGQIMAARAGFDPMAAIAAWEELAAEVPEIIYGGRVPFPRSQTRFGLFRVRHHALAERLEAIRSTARELSEKLARGEDLLP